jgi:hypothetical protein
MPNRRAIAAVAIIVTLTLPAAREAFALDKEPPRLVTGYALALEAECAADTNRTLHNNKSSPKLVQLAVDGPQRKIFVVDGNYTQCNENGFQWCGTGGCPLAVFSVQDGETFNETTVLYEQNAWGWKLSEVPS